MDKTQKQQRTAVQKYLPQLFARVLESTPSLSANSLLSFNCYFMLDIMLEA